MYIKQGVYFICNIMATTITREKLLAMYKESNQVDKTQYIQQQVKQFHEYVIYRNSIGHKNAWESYSNEPPYVIAAIVRKMQDIFVDSAIVVTDTKVVTPPVTTIEIMWE
jgi:hypothetical protein